MDENLVSVEVYEDPNGEPRYESYGYETEVKLRIVGLESGTTSIWLEAGFLDHDYGEVFLVSESYEIYVEVH